jgi:uncharacterized protein (TIGR00251 family)
VSENGIKISVRVTPNSPSNQIQGLANGVWKVRIAAPPDKGKANKELLDFLARKLNLRKDNLTLLRGASTRTKMIGVTGLVQEEVFRLLSLG